MRWAFFCCCYLLITVFIWQIISLSQLHTILVCSVYQVCNVYQQWGGTQPGCLPVLPSHLLQGFPAHHRGNRAQGLDWQGLCHLTGPGDGWDPSLVHGQHNADYFQFFTRYFSAVSRRKFKLADILCICFSGGAIQVTMWNVKLETRRQFYASCRTSSWSLYQSQAALLFGQITASHRAPCLWSVMWRQCQTQTQRVIQAWFPPWSPSRPLSLKHMILCLELRNYWVTQPPHRTARGTFLGLSPTQQVGLWTGALWCVRCA